MSGIIVGIILGAIIWGIILSGLLAAWLPVIFGLVGIIAVYILLETREKE